jgi:Raf kinase inhibitor-like YbhB/YbcL family protein
MSAHTLSGGDAHYDWSVRPSETVLPRWSEVAACAAGNVARVDAAGPAQAMAFAAFSPKVTVRWDDAFLYVESNGIPAHGMMVGITAWQQQVPLPQAYTGANAWRIPLAPKPAAQPASIRNRFLRGAIALAANGIPIFNPQNNRGEVSAEIGELDQWGGHCGRADDYHYHAAPLHLQAVLGPSLPVAYALDGYPIYGLSEPDGSTPAQLDAFNGHETPSLGYHYHASKKYPYVNGGFHGEVVERDEQVDPQPRAQSPRPALTALRGAKITEFTLNSDQRGGVLKYTQGAGVGSVTYAPADGAAWKFRFVSADGAVREETYRGGDRPRAGGKKGPGGPKQDGPHKSAQARPVAPPPPDVSAASVPPANTSANAGSLVLRSPVVAAGAELPTEFTGDGAGISPPLEWSGAPANTRAFAVIMHHLDAEGRTKWYWTIYNIPAEQRALPANAHGIGVLGSNGINRRVGYAPPHSKGPGAKSYTLTLYALSAPLQIELSPQEVDRDVLLRAMQGLVLAEAELKIVSTRQGAEPGGGRGKAGE